MINLAKLSLILLIISATTTRNLQTVYDVIVIGAGSSGVGASVALSEKNINHIILQARDRFGGRTYATTVGGVNVDLGASFVHSPEKNNAIDTYVKKLSWGSTSAGFSNSQYLYETTSTLNNTDKTNGYNIYKEFQTYVSTLVSSGTDTDLANAWESFKVSVSGKGYTQNQLDRAKFQLYLEATLNGGDLNTLSSIAFNSQSAKGATDYLPATSYAALIQAIYKTYCKNTPIIYKQPVTNIDYSGSVVKITTSNNQVYYAKKVINTIPLGVLKSGSVTFTPALPTEYQTAISSIAMGVFNKVIVILDGEFWDTPLTTRVVDLVVPASSTVQFPQFYIQPTTPKVLLFFTAGNTSVTLNQKTDAQLIAYLKTIIAKYDSSNQNLNITNYHITRWENEPYSKGSYSYYKVGTTAAHFRTLSTSISNKLWFAGQHVHPNQSSNVHGAFQTGLWAGQSAAWERWMWMGGLVMIWLLV